MALLFLDNTFTPKKPPDTLPNLYSPLLQPRTPNPVPSPPHRCPITLPFLKNLSPKISPSNHPSTQPTLKKKKHQLTAPPMINTLSSSLLTHCTTLFALCVSAFLLQYGPATQYSSKSGVVHASETRVRLMLCWTLGCVGLVWIAACRRW